MWFHLKPFDLNPFNIDLGGWLVYDLFEKEEEIEEIDEEWNKIITKKEKDFVDFSVF